MTGPCTPAARTRTHLRAHKHTHTHTLTIPCRARRSPIKPGCSGRLGVRGELVGSTSAGKGVACQLSQSEHASGRSPPRVQALSPS